MARKPTPQPVVIPDTPEAREAMNQIFKEAGDAQMRYFDGFEKALPNLPISDELKADFAAAIAHGRKKNS